MHSLIKNISIYLTLMVSPFLLIAGQSLPDHKMSSPILSDSFEWLCLSNTPINIPLKRVGNLFLLEANIDGKFGNLVLDLGAPGLVVNEIYFRNYTIDETEFSGTLLAQNKPVKKVVIDAFQIASINYGSIEAGVVDLGEIENKRGVKVLGLAGVALFKHYIFDFDFYHQQLILYKPKDPLLNLDKLILKTPFKIRNNVLSIECQKKGNSLTFSLDTGSERNILDNNLPNEVYDHMKILGSNVIQDAEGNRSEALLAVMDDIYIDQFKLKRMRTLILNLSTMSRVYGKKVDGMLGYPFFSSGRIVLDFKKKLLYIYKIKPQGK